MSVKHLLKDFILPTKVTKTEEIVSENIAVISIDTFERGFATTFGNSLRRTLLSSIQSFSVTGVRVTVFADGSEQRFITSEYDAIPGIKEDTIDVFDAIKGMKFIVDDENKTSFTLEAECSGKHKFDMSVFEAFGVRILNASNTLMTAMDDINIRIELQIELGRGYVPAEENEKRIDEEGVIALDAVFSPVVNVSYHVENVRIERRNDYEKLLLKVETDSSISPIDAVSHAAKLVKDMLQLLINFEESLVHVAPVLDETSIDLDKKLNISIEELELSQRSSNCFRLAKIIMVRDLVKMSEREVENLPNFGKKCMDEVKERLKELELSFEMDVEESVVSKPILP